MSYSGNKTMHCKKCGRKTKWVKCPQPPGCNGKGNGWSTQCGNNCNDGYKCENGQKDKWHS